MPWLQSVDLSLSPFAIRPSPLAEFIMKHHQTKIKVRFNEVDAYRVAWHGHYVAWMEVGRNDLAARFGLDADNLYAEGYLAPVVTLEVKYLKPARSGEELTILTSLRKSLTASLEFDCVIMGEDGKPCARGKTVHVLTDFNGVMHYRYPPVVEERLKALFAWSEEP